VPGPQPVGDGVQLERVVDDAHRGADAIRSGRASS
jgi:hypothetical protein